MTGVEAVSNGVMAFKEPRARTAQRTLGVIIAILAVLLFGIAWLSKAYGVTAMNPDAHNYQSVVSILTSAIFGRNWFYFLTMAFILAALSLSANTAFAGFPRLAKAVAERDYLPHMFSLRGRRLLYTRGIYVLAAFTAFILIIFGGVTDRLIPLYAIGAFMAFTLSQSGMAMHWMKLKNKHPGWRWRLAINGIGAIATGITTLVVLVAKFSTGAWVTALLIPAIILLMIGVKRHYTRVGREMKDAAPLNLWNLNEPIVVIPMSRWDRIAEKALRFGILMSKEMKVVHIHSEDEPEELKKEWGEKIIGPILRVGLPAPELVTIASNYRVIVHPLMDYILQLEHDNPDRKIAVLLPELVVKHWWEYALHNQRAQLLKLLLLIKGNQRIVVVNIPWYL